MSQPSLIYRSPRVYGIVMRALYGRNHAARLDAVAAQVPHGASVLELCCGPGELCSRLRAADYLGLDANGRFVAAVRARGGRAEQTVLGPDSDLPPADVVVMQASLYHFLPAPQGIVDAMLRAARERVVISEPVRNLSDSSFGPLRKLARRSSDPGVDASSNRFDEPRFDALIERYNERVVLCELVSGGRDKLAVLSAVSASTM